ncbi:MAG TPA: type I-C CRISPR-associated protein Cas8c/Csd1 [Thermoanaerobaculia bacterium]|nr:type I-C CRISPR-associated protein Cas8c/Csd1 [Thermoanaerobaculia bacterium]
MILQALYNLAQAEGLVEDPDFQPKALAWLLTIAEDGALLGLHGTHTVKATAAGKNEGKKKPRPLPAFYSVPREAERTSGDRAFFLFDKAEYVFGLDPEPDPAKRRPAEKLAARFALFRERAEACLAATGDPGVRAVCRFLARVAEGEIAVTLPEGCAGNDLFGFVYAPDVDRLVTARPAVVESWRSLRSQAESGEALSLCLVSGHLAPAAAVVPLIKNVPGGSTSGVALVSCNANAFESYGWSGNDNSPISRAAAEACSTALNRLLHPAFPKPGAPGESLPSRHLRLCADTAVCFWTAEPADDFASELLGLLDANPESVGGLYRSVWRGLPVEIDDPGAFYALTLSGTQGRLILRDWLSTPVRDAVRHLAEHFRDLAIVRNTPPPKERPLGPALPLRVLLRALAVRGDDKSVPAALAGEIVHAALTGLPYPFSILPRALERARAEIGRDDWADLERRDARAALLKAVLNRRRRLFPATAAYPEVLEHMDPNNTQPGYLLGRLMALLERMQQLALNEVNASVVDRFFSAASATPRVVFLRLLKNFRHHVKKAQDEPRTAGAAVLVERQVDRLVHDLGESAGNFPAALSLEEQGLFLLGYHHQRHEIFLTREERQRRAAEAAEAAAPSPETLSEPAGA